MTYKNILLIALASSFLIGCDPQEDMGSNPLRAKAHEIEQKQEQEGREQECISIVSLKSKNKKGANKKQGMVNRYQTLLKKHLTEETVCLGQ